MQEQISPDNAPVVDAPDDTLLLVDGSSYLYRAFHAGGDGQLRGDQRIERLHHQDSGSTIDELRVGGESQIITVKPNNRAPAYEINPERTNPTANSGQRMWNLLKF